MRNRKVERRANGPLHALDLIRSVNVVGNVSNFGNIRRGLLFHLASEPSAGCSKQLKTLPGNEKAVGLGIPILVIGEAFG